MKINIVGKESIPWWNAFGFKSKKTSKLYGIIESIDGAHHYIRTDNNFKYDVSELYPNEFEVN